MLIHRAYAAAHTARCLWWRLRRPTNHGVMVALWWEDSVLLVRNSYRRGWTLPGGFVGRKEALADAAARELGEEVGVRVPAKALSPVAVVYHETEFLKDHVHFFEFPLLETPAVRVDNREVIHAAFVEGRAALTLDLFAPVRQYLDDKLSAHEI